MMLAIFLLITHTMFSDLRPPLDTINWRTRRELSWDDFQGAPNPTAPNAALTSTSIKFQYHYDKRSFLFQLQCIFHPGKSWVKIKNQRILAHEQGHFDIAQLYTRKLYKALKHYTFKPETVEADISAIYKQVAAEQAAYQEQYDQETNYSRNIAVQLDWQDKIDQELDSLAAFSDYPQ
jgi:hypothetical protein